MLTITVWNWIPTGLKEYVANLVCFPNRGTSLNPLATDWTTAIHRNFSLRRPCALANRGNYPMRSGGKAVWAWNVAHCLPLPISKLKKASDFASDEPLAWCSHIHNFNFTISRLHFTNTTALQSSRSDKLIENLMNASSEYRGCLHDVGLSCANRVSQRPGR
jgi:hypothetical protein